MAEIVRVKDRFYIRADSALADDRVQVLKYGDTFGVFNRSGDIESVGASKFGLFRSDTRHLSRMVMRINGTEPLLLGSEVRDDNSYLSVDLTNLDASTDGGASLPRGTVHLFRSTILGPGVCYEKVRLQNYGLQPLPVHLQFQFESDFADIFEVRGTARRARGERLPDSVEDSTAVLTYRGLDGITRCTRIAFSPQPRSLTTRQARYDLVLEPKTEVALYCTIWCRQSESQRCTGTFGETLETRQAHAGESPLGRCRITTSNKSFNAWLKRSEADLQMLMQGNPEGPYPYAGVPWFSTIFGRDGIITALECLLFAPSIAESVLGYLARTQATTVVPAQEAEPGKIVHEIRQGEMARLREVPFGCYYGSVDATPLFVVLAGRYYERTGNLEFIRDIWPNIRRALTWADTWGDADGDGFVEYCRRSENGLVQQGWKDSRDSIFHADGRLVEPPVALCEVQGYVYEAKCAAAMLARGLGETDFADELDCQAERLRKGFEEAFWCDDLGTYALALDGQKKPCRVRASNAGHALFCKIASQTRASRVASLLLSDQFFSGWGVRTLGAREVRYNPMSYHNGSVWPHDNAIVAMGLAQYGCQQEAVQIMTGLHESAMHIDAQRLPELFCGFHRRPDNSGPTLYPVACSPQAWSAGAVFMLLQACLNIQVKSAETKVYLAGSVLPGWLDEVCIGNLSVAEREIDVLIRRNAHGVVVEVGRKTGEIQVLASA